MANSKGKQAAKRKVDFKGYLRVNLTEEQDTQFDAWSPAESIQLSDFDILANNGYKLSVSWDSFNDGVVATLYANDSKLPHAGWTLTAWADNAESAIALLFYKHYVVCEEDWEQFKDVVSKQGRRRG